MALSEEKNKQNEGVQKPTPPSISLPKGGGAIRGIGEKFAANPVTGTGSMTVPIATSPGRSGFGPQLSLSYDSGSGNGPFGFGWNLSLPSITRKTDKGLPKYQDGDESDTFILSGAEDLVPVLKKQGNDWVPEDVPDRTITTETYSIKRYRPRIEGLFARIERWTNTKSNETHWRSISRDNIITVYGRTTDSRIEDPEAPDGFPRAFSWLICESYDDKGNAIYYEYEPENSAGIDRSQTNERNRTDKSRSANRYLKRIKYGNKTPVAHDSNLPREFREDLSERADWLFEVAFDYEEGHYEELPADPNAHQFVHAYKDPTQDWQRRQDPFSSYRAGFEVRTYRLCHRVLMFHHFPHELGVDDYLVRSTGFQYKESPIASFITSITQSGFKRQDNGTYLKKSLPPLEFEYSEATIQDKVQDVDEESIENLPQGLDGVQYQWVDIDGEGLSGILTEQGDAWLYKRNVSPLPIVGPDGQLQVVARFDPIERLAIIPSFANLPSGRQQLLDLAGDGQLDVVEFDRPTPGFYERTKDEAWHPFRPFKSLPNISWQDPNLKFVDLTGDGHADIFITEEEAFIWYLSLAETGFATGEKVCQALDEEKGPKLVFADSTQSIYLADISGDGLSDLVRIRNGEVCYWPNLGYGRFGAKVTMDNSPHFDTPDHFDQRRIRLADIDGSGVTDIIYLKGDGVYIYLNESGNRWADAEKLKSFPQIDNLSSVIAVDLLGNGTACLVWSSPLPAANGRPLRYIDLMGGQKPHLLVKTANNLGAETRVHYAPSTKFYLADKEAGKPWITRIPFPVHVVERVETFDRVSRNRFVTRYAYHHGYFDGTEREFRGFGMVEQWDTEEYATIEGNEAFLTSTNFAESSHMPPVHTKTWFHTGISVGRAHVSNFFAGLLDLHDRGEYYREPAWRDDDDEAARRLLQDTILPAGLTADEEREACRALKGMMLRQEVYADDGSDKAEHPYAVTEQNFTVSLLQPCEGNRHAVFFTHAREAISYHYERNSEDPRTTHALTLEVDDFGNVLKSVAIGYGRRIGLSPLAGDDRQKQEQMLITYTENVVTESITDPALYPDDYRTPLPCEARTYELTGFDLTEIELRFSFEFFTANNFEKLLAASEIAYEETPDETLRQKRLFEHVRILYRANDLSGPLGLRELESLALPYESYKLAFTPGLLAQVFQRPLDIVRPPGAPPPENLLPDASDVLDHEGVYVHSEGDNSWWIPSGQVFYSPNAEDSSAEELAEAQAHFFLPRRFRDPFGESVTGEYDEYDLLIVRTTDPLDNIVTANNDYRVLQPSLLIDSNGNRSQVAFDALGMVAGTAVMGKRDETLGDSLAGFESDLTPEQIEDFFNAADPHDQAPTLLGSATTRILYDLDRFRLSREAHSDDPSQWTPVFAATIARETHASDLLPPEGLKLQIIFSYSDGFSREIQKKIQAEPGPVEGLGDLVAPRWVGSGWTIFNNKGKPVRQYEPFFSRLPQRRHHFEFGVQVGVSPVLFHDPVGRVVATLHPNHTYEKVVFDPWHQTTYDVNDTCAPRNDQTGDPHTDPDIQGYVDKYFEAQSAGWQTWHAQRLGGALGPYEQAAATRAANHVDTPTIAYFDALGRPFLTVAHNRFTRDGAWVDEHYSTCVVLDIEGNQREVIDAKLDPLTQRGRVVMRYDYDMLGNRIHRASMEAGERWILNDVTGKPIRSWDSRGHRFRTEYDALRRPTQRYVTGTDAERSDSRTLGDRILYEKLVYGEDFPGDRTAAAAQNLLTRVWKQFDSAGVVTSESYDFKGNLLRSSRRLVKDYKTAPNWEVFPEPEESPHDWETELFQSSTRYDALNRPIQLVAPNAGSETDVIRPGYNEANLLERVDVWLKYAGEPAALLTPDTADEHFVTNIDYNAKGQRTLIEYGSGATPGRQGVTTTYTYDSETFRLIRLHTIRPPGLNSFAGQLFVDPATVQDLRYAYDPAGNITSIRDDALPVINYNNGQIFPVSDYTYDAIYRLITAEGREHIGQAALNFHPADGNYRDYHFEGLRAHPNDRQAVRNYTEHYEYDEVGNFESMSHRARDGNWVRSYAYEEPSLIEGPSPSEPGRQNNRLSHTTIVGETFTYTHDIHGNMTRMPHLARMDWDFHDQLQRVDLGGGGTAYYVYDATGQRVRKVIERLNGNIQKECIYLGGFEVYRQYNGGVEENLTLEREILHIMDDQQRIAMVEIRTVGHDAAPWQLIRYQLANHLGSASLELDAVGQVISYEEYYPYGSTSYQAVRSDIEVNTKGYRYTGMERDEETGLNYHMARYYASWLGRWISCDPDGLVDGINTYAYTKNNPILFRDTGGMFRSTDEMINFLLIVNTDVRQRLHTRGTVPFETHPTYTGWDVSAGTRYGHSYRRESTRGEAYQYVGQIAMSYALEFDTDFGDDTGEVFLRLIMGLASESHGTFGKRAHNWEGTPSSSGSGARTSRSSSWGVFQALPEIWQTMTGDPGRMPWEANPFEEIAIPIQHYARIYREFLEIGEEGADTGDLSAAQWAARAVFLYHTYSGGPYTRFRGSARRRSSFVRAWNEVRTMRHRRGSLGNAIDTRLREVGILEGPASTRRGRDITLETTILPELVTQYREAQRVINLFTPTTSSERLECDLCGEGPIGLPLYRVWQTMAE